jgi:hypothetical protein
MELVIKNGDYNSESSDFVQHEELSEREREIL